MLRVANGGAAVSFGENTLNPFEIQEAREAQFTASKAQRDTADLLAQKMRDLAAAERTYREALTARIKELHTQGFDGSKPIAITTCEVIAKGEASIAVLREKRDQAKADVKKAEQIAFTVGADRRGLDGIIRWSEGRDLRVDVEPGSQRQWADEQRPKPVAA